MSRAPLVPLSIALTMVALAATCGSSGKKLSSPKTPTQTAAPSTATQSVPLAIGADYHPRIDATKFSNHVTNRYFPLTPGRTYHYRGIRDGVPTQHMFTVTHDTRGAAAAR